MLLFASCSGLNGLKSLLNHVEWLRSGESGGKAGIANALFIRLISAFPNIVSLASLHSVSFASVYHFVYFVYSVYQLVYSVYHLVYSITRIMSKRSTSGSASSAAPRQPPHHKASPFSLSFSPFHFAPRFRQKPISSGMPGMRNQDVAAAFNELNRRSE